MRSPESSTSEDLSNVSISAQNIGGFVAGIEMAADEAHARLTDR